MPTELPKLVVPGQPLVPELDSESQSANSIIVARKYVAGPGTKAHVVVVNGISITIISATVKGVPKLSQIENQESSVSGEDKNNTKTNSLPLVVYEVSVYNARTNVYLPKENDVVLAKITRITAKQAHCDILSMEGKGNVLKDGGSGSNGTRGSSSGQLLVSNPAAGSTATSQVFFSAIGATSSSLQSHPSDLGENFRGIIRVQDIRATERDKVKIETSFKPGDIVKAEIINLGDGANYYLSTAKNELGVVLGRVPATGELLYPLDYETMAWENGTEKRKVAKPVV